jgi:hypothetical protein
LGVAATALGLAIASTLCRTAKADWRIFAPPLGRMALATAVPTMLLGSGWGYLVRDRSSAFYLALALSWWLGGGTLALMTQQYRLRSLVLAAALAFPIAVWLMLDWTGLDRATFALGWAALTPLYFTAGYWLWQHADDETFQSFSRIVLAVGWLMVALAAVWPLTNPATARFVHLWLAVTMVLVTYLRQQPRTLWLMSLFLMMAATMWQGSLGAAPAEVTLSWSLLAILHVATAVWLDGRQSSVISKQYSVNSYQYSASLFGAGWVLAGLALVPPLFFGETAMLTYALGNWIGLNGWLAYVAHGRQHPGLLAFLHHPRLQQLPTQTLFQWLTALSTLAWLGLVWSNRGWANEYLALAYTVLAWGLLILGVRLRRLDWAYGAPWHVSAHLGTFIALALVILYRQQTVFAAVILAAAVFHFASTWLMPRWRWLGLFVGGLLLPIGWLSGLEWLGVSSQVLLPVLAAMVLIYLIVAKALEDLAGYKKSFTDPLEKAAMLLACVVVVWGAALARPWQF